MAGYLGQKPAVNGIYTVDEFTSSGGTTYTLSRAPGTKNNIQVNAGGLAQYPSAYSVSGTTLTLSGVPSGQKVVVRHMGETILYPALEDNAVTTAKINADAIDGTKIADNAINSEHYTDGSIDEAHIAADAVNFTTHLKAGTDGELITWDASGNPAAVPVGTAGQVLTSAGAGAPPTFAAAAGGGAWNLIGTQVASSSASLTQTGLDSTYDTYAIAISAMMPASNNATGYVRIGDSSGIDSGGSDYNFTMWQSSEGGGSYSGLARQGSDRMLETVAVSNGTGEGLGMMMYLHNPGDSAMKPVISCNGVAMSGSELRTVYGAGMREAVITVDRIQFILSTGNIASGRMTVWGIAHA